MAVIGGSLGAAVGTAAWLILKRAGAAMTSDPVAVDAQQVIADALTTASVYVEDEDAPRVAEFVVRRLRAAGLLLGPDEVAVPRDELGFVLQELTRIDWVDVDRAFVWEQLSAVARALLARLDSQP